MKVIVLKEGVHTDLGPKGEDIFNSCKEICGTVVLLKAEKKGEENIIVDTGNLGYEEEILEALEKQGLKPEDVEWVVITHSHDDHVSNNYLFKNAKRVAGIGVLFPDKSLDAYNDIDLIKIPGIKRIKTPGHLSAHLSIVVESEGKSYVIAGDAIQEEYIKKGLFGIPINLDYIDSAKKIVDIADVIIPGHGKIIEGKDLEELKKAVYKMEE
ncbi:MBL fold metallo-hydrolase [Candidatus Woesearchaeota archaeon]|nr:MBL fold metallo-hydrolase [Candidatus Woesearchaeota archaeon]